MKREIGLLSLGIFLIAPTAQACDIFTAGQVAVATFAKTLGAKSVFVSHGGLRVQDGTQFTATFQSSAGETLVGYVTIDRTTCEMVNSGFDTAGEIFVK